MIEDDEIEDDPTPKIPYCMSITITHQDGTVEEFSGGDEFPMFLGDRDTVVVAVSTSADRLEKGDRR